MLLLPLTYKNPCHCWPTRVCCHTLTKPDCLAPYRTRQKYHRTHSVTQWTFWASCCNAQRRIQDFGLGAAEFWPQGEALSPQVAQNRGFSLLYILLNFMILKNNLGGKRGCSKLGFSFKVAKLSWGQGGWAPRTPGSASDASFKYISRMGCPLTLISVLFSFNTNTHTHTHLKVITWRSAFTVVHKCFFNFCLWCHWKTGSLPLPLIYPCKPLKPDWVSMRMLDVRNWDISGRGIYYSSAQGA